MSPPDTLAMLGWRLDDFNQDLRAENAPPSDAPAPEPDAAEPVIQDDWADGYIHASRQLTMHPAPAFPRTELLGALRDMEARLLESVEDTALLVARLLLEAMATHGQQQWASFVQDRVQRMTDLIKPALMATVPQISVRSCDGETIELYAAPCTGAAEGGAKLADHITLSWHLGKAEAGWTTTLRETAAVLAPLILDLKPQTMDAA